MLFHLSVLYVCLVLLTQEMKRMHSELEDVKSAQKREVKNYIYVSHNASLCAFRFENCR